MSIVIVEGVDGAGKTRLLHDLRLQTKLYFWVCSSSGRPTTLEQLYEAMHLIGQAAYLKIPLLCDRFPLISEGVYGPAIRGINLLDRLSRRDREAAATMVMEQVDRVIYCRPPIEVIKANIDRSDLPQMKGVKEHLHDLITRYDDLMESLRDQNVKVYKYDYTRVQPTSIEQLFFGRIANG